MIIECKCKVCSKMLLKKSSSIKNIKYGPFCSKKCLGVFRSKNLKGTMAANFKRGFKMDRKYINVICPWHPNKSNAGVVSLHRVIAEAKIGRFLKKNEIVHHKDHNPENNHWDNLEIMTQKQHAKAHSYERKRSSKNGRFL